MELPTILDTNQHSLSDAEDFTEGYRTGKDSQLDVAVRDLLKQVAPRTRAEAR